MKVSAKERSLLVILFVLVIVAVALAAYIFLPTAQIRMVLRAAPLAVDQELTIRAEDTTPPDVIPGTAFRRQVQVEGTSPVTSRQVVGDKATGVAQIVNRTVEEQKIVERSRLVTKDGQLFYMTTHAIVPAASAGSPTRVTVPIEAAQAGPAGNIGPQRLDFAGLDQSSQQLVYAETTQQLTGGSGQEVAVVQEADLEAARQAAAQAARQKTEEQIRQELPKGWTLLGESWTATIQSFDSNATVDSQQSEITFRGQVEVAVLGYEEAKLDGRLKMALDKMLDADYMLFPGPIAYTSSVKDIDWDKGQGTLAVRVTHTTIPRFSLDTLKDKLSGRGRNEAQAYLEGLPGVRSVAIELWPFWVNSIPTIHNRISLTLEPERGP